MRSEIVEYAEKPGGGRRRSFDAVPGVTVYVDPINGDSDDAARAVARGLCDTATMHRRLLELEEELHRTRAELSAAKARIPPPSPARLLGRGCVRFDERGRLWLLNKREKGWSSFGVICDGWDDLFRRYNAVVVAHGEDRWGAWWETEPAGGSEGC